MKKVLNGFGLDLKKEFEASGLISCSCHICTPCLYCEHPGNPDNLKTNDLAWMYESNSKESDPNGLQPSQSGAKMDAGKPKCAEILGMFAHALWEVSKVGTFGADKYSMGGWQNVEEGEVRYANAGLRHFLKEQMGEETDIDSNLLHLSHEAWNSLAKLELYVREKKECGGYEL